MAEESGNLLLATGGSSGGAKAIGLILCCSSDERTVVPESNSVCHRRIALCKEVLKLIGLKVVRDGIVAAISRPTLALPPFVTHLLPLHRLHQWLHRRLSIRNNNQHGCNTHHKNPCWVHLSLFLLPSTMLCSVVCLFGFRDTI